MERLTNASTVSMELLLSDAFSSSGQLLPEAGGYQRDLLNGVVVGMSVAATLLCVATALAAFITCTSEHCLERGPEDSTVIVK